MKRAFYNPPSAHQQEWSTLRRWERQDAHAESAYWQRPLYSERWEAMTLDALRGALAEEGIEISTAIDRAPDTEEFSYDGSNREGIPSCNSCKSTFVDSFSSEGGWRCEHGGCYARQIWGCLDCAFVVCDECVRMVRPQNVDTLSLGDIASYFGLSRERVRQIEDGALRRLRRRAAVPGAEESVLLNYWEDEPTEDETLRIQVARTGSALHELHGRDRLSASQLSQLRRLARKDAIGRRRDMRFFALELQWFAKFDPERKTWSITDRGRKHLASTENAAVLRRVA